MNNSTQIDTLIVNLSAAYKKYRSLPWDIKYFVAPQHIQIALDDGTLRKIWENGSSEMKDKIKQVPEAPIEYRSLIGFLLYLEQPLLIDCFFRCHLTDERIGHSPLSREGLREVISSTSLRDPQMTLFINRFEKEQYEWFAQKLKLGGEIQKFNQFLPINHELGKSGSGSMANVYQATALVGLHNFHTELLASKIFQLDRNSAFRREYEINQRFRHPCILRAYAAVEYKNRDMILFPRALGDLGDIIKFGTSGFDFQIDIDYIINNLTGLVSALQHMVTADVEREWWHTDISFKNILIMPDSKLCLHDFGNATYASRLPKVVGRSSSSSSLGCYAPPDQYCSHKLDIWVLGAIFLELLVFVDGGLDSLVKFRQDRCVDRIVNNIIHRGDQSFHNDGQLHPRVIDILEIFRKKHAINPRYLGLSIILQRMLNVDEHNRPDASHIVSWLKDPNIIQTFQEKCNPTIVPRKPWKWLTNGGIPGSWERLKPYWQCITTPLKLLYSWLSDSKASDEVDTRQRSVTSMDHTEFREDKDEVANRKQKEQKRKNLGKRQVL